MMEQTYNLPKEREWVMRRDNWMSDTVQNEIISQFAHAIQRKIISRSSDCDFFGLIGDCTTDISTSEHFSCGLQYVDSNLESHWDFFGFYKCLDTTAETLFRCVKDLFMRINIPICFLQGYCFDGGSNMSGHLSGVQEAQLSEASPHSLYVHCSNHSLDQEVAREVSLITEGLNFVQSVAVLIKESAKCKQLFESLFGCEDIIVKLLGLCPMRWCVQTKASQCCCSSYLVILTTLKTLKEDKGVRGDTRAKIHQLHKQALKAKTLFRLSSTIWAMWNSGKEPAR